MKTIRYAYKTSFFDVNCSNSTREFSKYSLKAFLRSNSSTEPFFWHKLAIYLSLPLIATGVALLGGCSGSPNVSPPQQTTSQAQQTTPQALESALG